MLAISAAVCPRGTLPAVPARSVPQSETEPGGDPEPELSSAWLLLIYTVPAQPSRKRATVWREIKRLGAVYLHDGVCVLPEQPGALINLRALASRIETMDGQATIVEHAQLDSDRAEQLKTQCRA